MQAQGWQDRYKELFSQIPGSSDRPPCDVSSESTSNSNARSGKNGKPFYGPLWRRIGNFVRSLLDHRPGKFYNVSDITRAPLDPLTNTCATTHLLNHHPRILSRIEFRTLECRQIDFKQVLITPFVQELHTADGDFDKIRSVCGFCQIKSFAGTYPFIYEYLQLSAFFFFLSTIVYGWFIFKTFFSKCFVAAP